MEQADEAGSPRRSSRRSFDARPHVLNITNCIVGVSVLAMPYCFQQCGILLGVAMIAICSTVTKLTCHFLFVGATIMRVRSYESLAAATFGSIGRRTIEVLMLAFLMSTIVAYLVVIGDLGPHIVADYLELAAPTEKLRVLVMVLTTLFVVIPLSTIKDLEVFSVVSSVAVLFYGVFVLRIVVESLSSFSTGAWSVAVVWWRPEGFLACVPIVAMALACQTQLFHVVECIDSPSVEQVDSVVAHAINLCSAMYAAVGLFGYVAFFDRSLHGDVLVELAPTFLTQLLKLSFMLSVAVSIPLMLFPARAALFNLTLRPEGCELPVGRIQRSTFHILSVVIIGGNLLVAVFIPNVEFILGLTGSLIGSTITMIVPSLMFIAVARSANYKNLRLAAQACLLAGICILVLSTYVTLTKEQKSDLAERPEPKDKNGELEVKVLENLEKLEERVLDANLNISQKLDDISQLAAEGKEKEAKKVIEEIKHQQEEQKELIQKQEKIVEDLNKHIEVHEMMDKEKGSREGKEKEKREHNDSAKASALDGDKKKDAPLPPSIRPPKGDVFTGNEPPQENVVELVRPTKRKEEAVENKAEEVK